MLKEQIGGTWKKVLTELYHFTSIQNKWQENPKPRTVNFDPKYTKCPNALLVWESGIGGKQKF